MQRGVAEEADIEGGGWPVWPILDEKRVLVHRHRAQIRRGDEEKLDGDADQDQRHAHRRSAEGHRRLPRLRRQGLRLGLLSPGQGADGR